MNYLKITKYIYLVFGFVMLVVSIIDWNNDKNPIVTVLFAAVAFFMFFFRSRFQNRFDSKDSQNRQ